MNKFFSVCLSVLANVTRRAGCVLLFALMLAANAWGQSEVPRKAGSGTSNELVDGLLDLLAEPKSAASGLPPAVTATPKLAPAEVGLDGEDLGQSGHSHPLASVRQSMLMAAGYLRKGVTNTQTQQLQSNIVERLDDIIKELERSPPPNRSPREQQSSSAEQSQPAEQRQQQSQVAKPPRTTEADQPGQSDEPGQSQGQSDERPKERATGSLTVDLADPKSLQQSVWGQLPERVRQQMQSRMVEQFLPAYREQIEAYFQALLK